MAGADHGGRGQGRGGQHRWACLTFAVTVVATLAATAGVPTVAHAQIVAEPESPYPDPRHFARGFFLQGEAGAMIPLGTARAAIAAGPALGVRMGYEFARWVALQAHVFGSTHSVDLAGSPLAAQMLQISQASAELRVAVPIAAWSIFAQGGAGRARLSTNVLGTAGLTAPGVRTSMVYGGSGGVDYHTRSRHFSCGLVVGFAKLPAITTTGAVHTALYLRHAF